MIKVIVTETELDSELDFKKAGVTNFVQERQTKASKRDVLGLSLYGNWCLTRVGRNFLSIKTRRWILFM